MDMLMDDEELYLLYIELFPSTDFIISLCV